jgi:hypothetical protein
MTRAQEKRLDSVEESALPAQHGRGRHGHGPEAADDAFLEVGAETDGGVGDAADHRQDHDPGGDEVDVLDRAGLLADCAAEHVVEQEQHRDRHQDDGDDRVDAAGGVTEASLRHRPGVSERVHVEPLGGRRGS